MPQLRNYGVYQPPGNVRPIVAVRDDGVYHLYDKVYGVALRPRYTVEPDGSVTNWHGDRVGWTVDDLVDLGETRGIDGS